ncbi:malto-oligosyltrehalose synthase [Salinicola sp. DM10]|uniref:malto-oligosyltrehalose synthase n=1 Tax=Salinicola sp. DM10 TaxID=2815721 RepID=UPI001A8E3C94|nr:malto-oligosyltrehalose synthase [Salinicola sp. DM10]MCE3028362.1 malto-oligosyltrehalose synthase [Salinicola sp. DM10]
MRPIRATVRLQLHAGFDFAAARAQVDYYAALGVSHYYLSPILTSRPGSTHGYDGVDPTRIDPELGGEAELAALVEALHARGMGIVADIVPNHLAIGADNPWWQDMLARGRASEFADCFDVDWGRADLDGKLLLPLLGERYVDVLAAGELTLSWAEAAQRFEVRYHEHRFPIDPAHSAALFALGGVETFESEAAEPDAIKAALAAFDSRHESGRARLHGLLERQAYRLAYWRSANDALNWRRFFDITELAGVRVEDSHVFALCHDTVLGLVARGWIDGLRVDHIDGLVDPRGYAQRLRERLDAIAAERGETRIPLYVEKILAGHEALHSDWGVDGTTGYEFLDVISGVQHDPAGEAPFAALWREVSGRSGDFSAEVAAARSEMLTGPLCAEFERCIAALCALARHLPATRELSEPALRRVLGALAIGYPVYRSYADRHGRPQADAADFDHALESARVRLSAADAAWLATLDDWLGGVAPETLEAPEQALRLRAIATFQQLTSPLAAKAVEDTAGYRSAVLLSRNDVGCEGAHFAYPVSQLHAANRTRLARFPHSLLATATHDHKRGEDVRARLAALSECQDLIPRLRELADDPRLGAGAAGIGGGDRLMLLQILLAAWPLGLAAEDSDGLAAFAERVMAWQQKALREAKLHSHWLAPDAAYEEAAAAALQRALDGGELTRALAALAAALDLPGAINGLAQAALKLCAPGVPDLYQGTEFWDQSLVDPDNRRPVDMPARRAALDTDATPAAAWAHWRDGAVKQALIRRLLALRAEWPTLFLDGDYVPLGVTGQRAEHVIALARRSADATLVLVVPRLPRALLGATAGTTLAWGDTRVELAALGLEGAGVACLTATSAPADGLALSTHLADFPCGAWLWCDVSTSATP